MFQHVLVGTNGTSEATIAVRTAVALAEAHHARLTVLAAVRPPGPWMLGALTMFAVVPNERCTPDALREDAEHEAECWLAAACEHVPADLPLTKVLAFGGAAKALEARVREGRHDVVVVGRGRQGSVARHVLRHARVPVLVVGAGMHEVLSPPAAPHSTSVVP